MAEKCHSILFARNGRLLAEVASVSADLANGQVIPEHFHPEDQLLFASSGVMTLRTKGGIWVVPPLRAVWIPALTPHSVTMCAPVSMRTLYFLPRLCRALPRKCFVLGVSLLLRELILHACRFQKLNSKVAAQKRIIEIIVEQLKGVESAPLQLPHPADARALRIVKTLTENPADQRTLNKLCKDCGASKRTIQRLFLEETKMSFARWRQQLRLLHAIQSLAAGEKVTTAALDAGYNSTSAFIAMFRKQLGTTPMRYLQIGAEPQVSGA
jgi:AraC-like DNA-binding protein